jgi:gas vesicle protein
MSDKKKSSNLGVGIAVGTAIGAAAGAAAALLLAPQSGKKTRKDIQKKVNVLRKKLEDAELDEKVKDIFGDVTDEAREIYKGAKEGLIHRLADLKEAVEDIDYGKYQDAVEDVVTVARKKLSHHIKDADKLKNNLLKEWKKLNSHKKK